MNLRSLLKDLKFECIKGNLDITVSDIIYNSNNVINNSLFVCVSGAKTDGHDHIEEAVKKGAIALIVEKDIEVNGYVTVIKVPSTRQALAYLSAAYFDYPAKDLTTIAITGTKGKTTTSYMIKYALEKADKKVGLIGTIGAMIGDELIPLTNTTPVSYELHKMFRQMVDAGCEYVVMEASSQGFKLDRTAGIEFDYGIFTNLSRDHIGPAEHESMEEYLECKTMLFRQCKKGIINIDDEKSKDIIEGSTCEIQTYGCEKKADLMATDINFIKENGRIGIEFKTNGLFNENIKLFIPGRFSVYNALSTILICLDLGISDTNIINSLAMVQVKGRVEIIPVSDKFTLLIDYAHNELSTRSILTTLKEYNPSRIVCVFGGGGNRPKMRRFDMGKVVSELADFAILTCDNPRDEEISNINNDIKEGLAVNNGKFIEIEDRKEAIKYAIMNAGEGDMIVLLGKGHENYQEIKGVKHHFDEREAVAEIIKEI